MYVAIEGIIGSGKSTLARAVAERLGWMLLPEPVDENPVLGLFYEDQKRWAFPMQTALLHHRWRQQQVAGHSHTPCVLDRSLPGDRVFARLQFEYGNMHQKEWQIYQSCYDAMSTCRPPALLIYLDVSPETAMTRMTSRGRSVESGVEIQYLRDLQRGYERLLSDIDNGTEQWSRGLKVVRHDWNGDLDTKSRPFQQIVEEAANYVGK